MANERYQVRVEGRECSIVDTYRSDVIPLAYWTLAQTKRLNKMLNKGAAIVREAKRAARSN